MSMPSCPRCGTPDRVTEATEHEAERTGRTHWCTGCSSAVQDPNAPTADQVAYATRITEARRDTALRTLFTNEHHRRILAIVGSEPATDEVLLYLAENVLGPLLNEGSAS